MLDAKNAQKATMVEQALPIGDVLSDNQFRITGHLGAGGFGITYKAQDNVLGRTVVIKECFPEDFCFRDGRDVFARSNANAKPVRSIVDMFMREARSIAQLRHPNIVGVHGAFEENETAYMVLDLIDGPDLLSILETNSVTLSPRRVRRVLFQLLDAIEKVHAIDLLHRDISPDNIIIDGTGAPVLIDFGAARADASRRTRAVSSMLVVKDGYSPQEFYVAGSQQSPNSDLYALAATFYHVLTGGAPPHSQTRMIEIAGHKPDPCTPLVGRIDGYDDAFLQAIDQAMQIHPSDRLQSAAQWRRLIADCDPEAGQDDFGLTPDIIDLDLERSLSRLVEETNVEVKKSQLIQVEPPKTDAPALKDVPKPDWIEEFNRESRVLATEEMSVAMAGPSGQDEIGLTGDVATVAANIAKLKSDPANAETDWIDLASKKQEQICREQFARLEGAEISGTAAFEPPVEPEIQTAPLVQAGEGTSKTVQSGPKNWSFGILAGFAFCLGFLFVEFF